jgi:hypothetical protein
MPGRHQGHGMRYLLLTALLLAGTANAQTASVDRMRADIAALSADTMEGRFPGTPGQAKTLAWIEQAFAEAGLKVSRQPVVLFSRQPKSTILTARAGGQTLDLSAEALLLGRDALEMIKDAPVIYGGHGDQMVGADLSGAVVLFRDSDSPAETSPHPIDSVTRIAALKAAGALAVLAITPDRGFDNRRARVTPILQLREDQPFAVRGMVRETAARTLLAAAGADLAALDAQAAQPGFRPTPLPIRLDVTATTDIRRFLSANIIGRLTGAKPGAGTVLYTAHWDAFGRCKPEAAQAICSGAVDNASGIAGVLEVARLFRAGPPPERDIVFVATTAEEHGLLGSRAYVAAPAAPLASTVASINIDTIALYGKGHPVGYVGAGLTDADAALARLAADQGRMLDPGGGARFVYKSSDAWPLLKAGVPAYVLSGVISRGGADKGQAFTDFITQRAHLPADKLTPAVDLTGAAEDVDLSYRAGLAFSRADARIDFAPGSPFQRPKP